MKIYKKNKEYKLIEQIFHVASAQKTLPSTAKIKLQTCDVLPHGSSVFYFFFCLSNKLCKFFVCFQTWHPTLDAMEYKFMEIFAHQFGCLANGLPPPTRRNANHRYQKHTPIPRSGQCCRQTPLASLNLPPRVTNTWQSLLSTYLNRINFCALPGGGGGACMGKLQVNIRSDKLELHLSCREHAGGTYRLQNVV